MRRLFCEQCHTARKILRTIIKCKLSLNFYLNLGKCEEKFEFPRENNPRLANMSNILGTNNNNEYVDLVDDMKINEIVLRCKADVENCARQLGMILDDDKGLDIDLPQMIKDNEDDLEEQEDPEKK